MNLELIKSKKTIVKSDVEKKLEKIPNFESFWMNFGLMGSQKKLKMVIRTIDDIVSRVKKGDKIRVRRFGLHGRFPPYKYAIVDLEGDPPKFFGLVISNQVYQLFVTEIQFLEDLYNTIWKILNELIGFYLFTFSNHETRFFRRILPFKLELGNGESLFQVLKIVNVQEKSFEGLVPALYRLGEKSYHDPLLRDSKRIELHFKKGDYYLILEHNKSCLLSTLKIVQKRYLKLHLI